MIKVAFSSSFKRAYKKRIKGKKDKEESRRQSAVETQYIESIMKKDAVSNEKDSRKQSAEGSLQRLGKT